MKFVFILTLILLTDKWPGISSVNIHQGELWPGGIVNYYFSPSLSEEDRKQVFIAFDEFHRKTCVRFEPKNLTSQDYVSIERDDKICGEANVCKIGGRQYAKFGANCTTTSHIIHELGHTLCLEHEHQRQDRDEYLHYDKRFCAGTSYNKKLSEHQAKPFGIYDYSSAMHSSCGDCNGGWPKQDVKFCGSEVTNSLSVLDVDSVNRLYKCQGCYRHRWIPIDLLTKADESRMFIFKYRNQMRIPLFTCRASSDGSLRVGRFHYESRACIISYLSKAYSIFKNFEILTIPDGLRNRDSEYMLIQIHEGKTKNDLESIFKNAVVAGNLQRFDEPGYGNGYVAVGVIKDLNISCSYDSDEVYGSDLGISKFKNNDTAIVVGSAWRLRNGYSASFAVCGKQIQLTNYSVLVCKERSPEISECLDSFEIVTSQELKYLETIDGELTSGSTIIVVGHTHSDAKAVSFELCEQKTNSSIILQFRIQFGCASEKSAISRNSYTIRNGWGHEEKDKNWEKFPFEKGETFKLVIKCHLKKFQFFLDGVSFLEYTYKQPLKLAKYLKISGDVDVVHAHIKRNEISYMPSKNSAYANKNMLNANLMFWSILLVLNYFLPA